MWRKAFALLPALYGGREVLTAAREKLPELSVVGRALDEIEAVCAAFPQQDVHIDLSELRVDNYHTGLLYAAYAADGHDALARGGRYDGLGGCFGRARPATGFSFDCANSSAGCRSTNAAPPSPWMRRIWPKPPKPLPRCVRRARRWRSITAFLPTAPSAARAACANRTARWVVTEQP